MGWLYTAAAVVPDCLLTSHLVERHVVKYTVSSARVEAPSQGEETQVHLGPEAEPKHFLPVPGHVRRRQRIPADRPADALSSALFSMTSECQRLGYSRQFRDPMAKAHLLQTKEEVACTGFSCRKHGLVLPLFSRDRVRKAQQREHSQKLHSLRQVRGTKELEKT